MSDVPYYKQMGLTLNVIQVPKIKTNEGKNSNSVASVHYRGPK